MLLFLRQQIITMTTGEKVADPLPMGVNGNPEPEAWYRTSIAIDSPGVYTLQLGMADRLATFVDGVRAGEINITDEEITFEFSKGTHTLAFFTAHDGLDKFAGYVGPLDSVDRKGLFGPATLNKGEASMQSLTNWRFLKAESIEAVNTEIPSSSLTTWKNYTIGEDVFSKRQGFGWFQTIIPKPAAGVSKIEIKFRSTDENATVFINQKKITRHEGWNRPFSISIDHADTITAPLQLTLFIENYSNEGGIDGSVLVNYIGKYSEIHNWRMFDGTGDLMSLGVWKNIDSAKQKGKPAFYHTTFSIKQNKSSSDLTVWRVNADGLGHGSVWVNGHNLGRYPEKDFVIGLYIPECWVHNGSNTLFIYDEDGKYPGKVSVQAEHAAGRIIKKLDVSKIFSLKIIYLVIWKVLLQ